MKKLSITLLVMLATSTMATSAFAVSQIRISQVYSGGGGGGAATYNRDYVEIFNSGANANIGNWTIEYGSDVGNWGASAGNIFTFPSGTTIFACAYILVALGTTGTGGAALPVTPDFSNTSTNMSATDGKVALFNAVNSNVACGSELAGTLVDKVAYGSGNCPEATATTALSITTGAVRNGGGMNDTDNNSADFTVTANPVPRNSASPRNGACLPTSTGPTTWGSVKILYR